MPGRQRQFVKYFELALVIIAACGLPIGLVMGPGLLSSIQVGPRIAQGDQSPAVVSGSSMVRSDAPETLRLPIIPARRAQRLRSTASPVAVRRSRTVTGKPVPRNPARMDSAGFTRVLRSVMQGRRIHGEDVRHLQIRLMLLAGVEPRTGGDGWFGPRTARGLRKFQLANGLPATGMADRRTSNALFSSQAKRFKY